MQTRASILRTGTCIALGNDVGSDFFQALKVANVSDPALCYFIDDNKSNVLAAKQLGWGRCVHFCEHGLESVEGGKKLVINNSDINNNEIVSVTNLEELRSVWPEIFKP